VPFGCDGISHPPYSAMVRGAGATRVPQSGRLQRSLEGTRTRARFPPPRKPFFFSRRRLAIGTSAASLWQRRKAAEETSSCPRASWTRRPTCSTHAVLPAQSWGLHVFFRDPAGSCASRATCARMSSETLRRTVTRRPMMRHNTRQFVHPLFRLGVYFYRHFVLRRGNRCCRRDAMAHRLWYGNPVNFFVFYF